MGLLKKLTKPLSKFLDKIIPNELKPALPYLSAFAPFMMGPGIMGAGMLQRFNVWRSKYFITISSRRK
jgi:hypothetical protein